MSPIKSLIIDKIVDVIKKTADPDKVVLFGSRAREGYGRGSDYDFMVVKKRVRNEREVSRRIYRALFDQKIKQAVDIIVVGADKLRAKQNNPYLIYFWALREGKVLYE